MAPNAGQSHDLQHKASETIMRNVRVIGVDQRLESKPGEAVIAHTATLEVTAKESEVLNLATEMGKLSLSLRSLAKTGDDLAQNGESDTPDSRLPADDSTYTLDSQVSPLLPKPLTGNNGSELGVVTILRGGGKGGESVGSPPASRGS
jgi:pilus assembly protein CpaB